MCTKQDSFTSSLPGFKVVQSAKDGGSKNTDQPGGSTSAFKQPAISLPKGGGAVRSIDEKFSANPVTGGGSMEVPITTSPGRSGFGPSLSISYDSGSGNGPFGLGWSLSLPTITRRTDKGIPKYDDDADIFVLSGAEDLVPTLASHSSSRFEETVRDGHTVRRYRPRIEGSFARIERWTSISDPADTHWRSVTSDNVTTLYGNSSASRVADPEDPSLVFQWLISFSYDRSGNAILYEYKAEDSANVPVRSQAHEETRTDSARSSNRYIKRIRYSNRTLGRPLTPGADGNWMFDVVFDYGEHASESPSPDDQAPWQYRQDPFSTHRAGFEIRSYRLCRRVLMFHRFPDDLGEPVTLVSSTNFTYNQSQALSFLIGVTVSGHRRPQPAAAYVAKSLPPLNFEYTAAPTVDRLSKMSVREVDPGSVENLPYGIDGNVYHWVDLDGEGHPSVLAETDNCWVYKRNTSASNRVADVSGSGDYRTDARLAPLKILPHKPAAQPLASGHTFFMDVDGDGLSELVQWDTVSQGFYHRSNDADNDKWDNFHTFESFPSIALGGADVRLADVTGDGLPDLLQVEDNVVTWLPSLGSQGFDKANITHMYGLHAPRLSFADAEQAVYLADMTGDGLVDLVRIRNGNISYWPNLGYGRFGPRVTMDNSPVMDRCDMFDQRRVHLADFDGSGTTDLLYLVHDGVRLYRNQAGNCWSNVQEVSIFPHVVQDLTTVAAVDLLGTGTACLVWSSGLPGDAQRPMLYFDLMDGCKPNLLTGVVNNLGAETRIHYTPSTYFSLRDSEAGRPWLTRLPFPVYCVERIVSYDRISHGQFTSRYAYHHGFYDGQEREFRGFAAVEKWDAEELSQDNASSPDVDKSVYAPPVHTKMWFHTGAYLGGKDIGDELAAEFYNAPPRDNPGFASFLKETLLDGNEMPSTSPELTGEEMREAYRALRGSILREEIYADDADLYDDSELRGRALVPFGINEYSYSVKLIQRQDVNLHSVFFCHRREALNHHLERNADDARISHALVLQIDEFGNALRSCKAVYGRERGKSALEVGDAAVQERSHVTYTEADYTNMVDSADDYRLPLGCEIRQFEITGFSPAGNRFAVADFIVDGSFEPIHAITEIPFEEAPTDTSPQKRRIGVSRTTYRSDDMSRLLPAGRLESRALPGEEYNLVLTPGILRRAFKHLDPDGDLIPNPSSVLGSPEGGYVDLDRNGQWWVPGGRIYYDPDPGATAAQELSTATKSFFLPRRYTDVFGNSGTVDFDNYQLLTVATRDALDNRVQCVNDYRTLQPRLVTDPNGNRGKVEFDALGVVVGHAVMGKASENLGDSLESFKADLAQSEIDDFFANPQGPVAQALIGTATSRVIYDVGKYWREADPQKREPAFVATVSRETHTSDAPSDPRLQVAFSYFDGFERVIQNKEQAEPDTSVSSGSAKPRFVGSGWTIFNNKGLPVRKYEPFFDDTHRFNSSPLVGVSRIVFYDPLSRVVGSVEPNHTFSKVRLSAWQQLSYDVNDTATFDPKTDPDLGPYFRLLPDADFSPTWYQARIGGAEGPDEAKAALKTAAHADTPETLHLDPLGRPFLQVVDNGPARKYATRTVLDIQGNMLQVRDAKNRVVERHDYDMLQNCLHKANMESGQSWRVKNAVGAALLSWNSRGFRTRCSYDTLQRPIENWVLEPGKAAEVLVNRTVYGESETGPDPTAANKRLRVVRSFEQAGILENEEFDFKGNLLRHSWRLCKEYKTTVDWSVSNAMEDTGYRFSQTYDALDRVVDQSSPDSSTVRHRYNDRKLLSGLAVNVRGEKTGTNQQIWTDVLTGLTYNAKGQRQSVSYGNGSETRYTYDAKTFRLARLQTSSDSLLQDLAYTYDPAGNVTTCRDSAQQTVFFRNKRVEPSNEYEYDPLYRLVLAQGREHLGLSSAGQPSPPSAPGGLDPSRTRLVHPGDGNAMGTYLESYNYDPAGNILSVQHVGSDPSSSGWTRRYTYGERSQLEVGQYSNRLSSTAIGNISESYQYDDGNPGQRGLVTSMPKITNMRWDFLDQLQSSSRQVVNGDAQPESTYYGYSIAGQRIRKVTEREASDTAAAEPARLKDRIYLGHFEIFRKYRGDGVAVSLERETLRVMDDHQQVALIESRTQGMDGSPARLLRYQYSNLLGSACLELDDAARIVSYEEYFPYGGTSYQATSSVTEVPKRYRFSGKEHDEETGLYYFGARFYAAWLGRWICADPGGLIDGPNLYLYAHCNPVVMKDPTGFDARKVTPKIRIIQKGEYYGTESQDDIRAAFAKIGRYYKGDAHFVGKVGKRGTWVVDKAQLTTKEQQGGNQAPSPAPAADDSSNEPPALPSPDGGSGEGTKGSGPQSRGSGGPKPGVAEHFAMGFAQGFAEGLAGGLVIGGLLATGGVFAVAGVGLMLAGAFMTGQTVGEMLFGNPSANRKAELVGGLVGGLAGGALAGGILAGRAARGGGQGKPPPPVIEEGAPAPGDGGVGKGAPPPAETGPTGGTRGAGDPAGGGGRDPTGFRGRRGEPMKYPYKGSRNNAEVINGRRYGGHALDQMQDRGIMPSVVENTIQYGKATPTRGRIAYTDPKNGVQVIVEGTDVVTVKHVGMER